MMRSRKIQYTAALVLITLGCGSALLYKSAGYMALCINGANIMMMRRSDLRASVPGRQIVWMIAILILVVILILLSVMYFPKRLDSSAYKRTFIIPFWAMLVAFYLWAWRKEARTPVATHTKPQ